MSTVNRILVAWLAVAMLLLGGCKKTVEGEQAAWTSNVEKVNALMATYPGFKPALEERMGKAKGIYDASEGLDGEAKANKLGEANSTLMGGYVRDLQQLDKDMKDLRTKRVEAAAKAGDESSRLGAKVAAEDANKALDRADKALAAGAKDEASATAVVKKIKDDIATAAKAVDAVLEADKDKKDEKKATEDAKEAKDAAAKADADAKVAPWKCEYCGSENPHDEASCKSCGAPRAK
ncbi:hypothetical protein [Paraliomyxa miuraensis]|uniref:hypothetical protein n=1 Tax=Paraliomyxa miuraensis TaxID=376150 RepID=UPI0022574B14|nr:hypothetical protein [Paraliomyxa miuraensis]MCX4245591.1 hypothetical protein [Paraliomyxa miuraensis]